MNFKTKLFFIFLITVGFLLKPAITKAVIPPDFVFNIGTQVAQFFSVVMIFFAGIWGFFLNLANTGRSFSKRKKIIFLLTFIFLILLSFLASYFYAIYKQKIEYQNWLKESQSFRLEEENSVDSLVTSTTSLEVVEKEPDNSFFLANKDKSLFITNSELKNILEGKEENYIILDAREDVEFENGYLPGSIHIRFADLKLSEWNKLPKDKFIYVVCWSGIRGKEVAEFLREKELVASYLENGANGWFEFGGIWEGSIKFLERYTDSKYQIVFSTNEVREKVAKGVILVDTREPEKFSKKHIEGSFSIPIMYTPTVGLEKVFSEIPPQSSVITVCDDYVNCFDAKITGVELEKRGHKFLGRYNKPWEYVN